MWKFLLPQKIQGQVVALLLSSITLPIIIIGSYGIYASTQAIQRALTIQEKSEILKRQSFFEAFIKQTNEDTRFLRNVPPIAGIFRARQGGGVDQLTNSTLTAWEERLQTIFLSLINSRNEYIELTYLDLEGNELVRVVRSSDQPNLPPDVIPSKSLVKQRNYPYQQALKQQIANELFVSLQHYQNSSNSVDSSNSSGNSTVNKHRLIAQFSLPILDARQEQIGVILIVADLQILLKDLSEVSLAGSEVLFTDLSGNYLNSRPSSTLTTDRQTSLPAILFGNSENRSGNRSGNSSENLAEMPSPEVTGGALNKDYSAEVTQTILQTKEGFGLRDRGYQFGFTTLNLGGSEDNQFKLLFRIPEAVAMQDLQRMKWVYLIVTLSTIGLAVTIVLVRLQQLRELIERLVNQVATSCQEIVVTMTEQEQVAASQSASINETATTMEQLGAASQRSEQQAVSAVHVAQQALEVSETGNRSVGETLAGMVELQEKVTAIAQQIQNLSIQAGEIGKISRLVSGMANQTNMLALNAAVEAVRAGEHGKGFSVVATEIRKLADESRQSAEKINQMVQAIQLEMGLAVRATEAGTQTLGFSLEASQRTAAAFSEVGDAIASVAFSSQEIAQLQKQQALAIQQVVDAVSSIDQGVRETVLGMSQTRSGTEQLNQVAQELKETL